MNPYGIALTLAVFYAFLELHRGKRAFYTNPVLLSIIAIAAFLWGGGYSYESYMESAVILKFSSGLPLSASWFQFTRAEGDS